MTTSAPQVSAPAASASSPAEDEIAQLQAALKRCSPATFEAACQFRRTGNVAHLRTVVRGVIERYVERELRPKVASGDASLRLIEDLGVDSLTMMEIVVLTEDVLHISVTNEELVHLRTLGDIDAFIAAKVTARG